LFESSPEWRAIAWGGAGVAKSSGCCASPDATHETSANVRAVTSREVEGAHEDFFPSNRRKNFSASSDELISSPHRDTEIIMHATSPEPDRLVGIATLVEILQRSRASIYRDIKNDAFPKPLKLGSSSRWRLSEVNAVIERLSDDRADH
jgi:predicted DNA-binding transcriptional regulator AlpA